MRRISLPVMLGIATAALVTPAVGASPNDPAPTANDSCLAFLLCVWVETHSYDEGCPWVSSGDGYVGALTGTWNYGEGYFYCQYTGIGQGL